MLVQLTDQDIALAHEIALERLTRYSTVENVQYRNTMKGQFTGSTGEVATVKVLKENGLPHTPGFRLHDSLPDIITKWGNEVKTWSAGSWTDLGRAVTVDQYPRVLLKAKVVIWCIHTPPNWVDIIGWNFVTDMKKYPVREILQRNRGIYVKNYQVPIDEIRCIDKLSDLVFAMYDSSTPYSYTDSVSTPPPSP